MERARTLVLQSVKLQRDRSPPRVEFATLGLKRFPVNSLALAQLRSTLLTKPNELRGMGKDQVFRVDSEGEDNGYGLSAARNQKGFPSLGSPYDVGCVGLEVSNSYRCHTVIVVPNVTTWEWLSYSNAGDKRWQMAALSEFRTLFPNGLQRSVNRKVQGFESLVRQF